MTEAEFAAAQAADQVKAVATEGQPLPTDFTLADLKKQFDTYLPFLERLRTTRSGVAAKMYLQAAQTVTATFPVPKVNLDTVVFANGVKTDVVGHSLQILTPGLYCIIGKACFSIPVSGTVNFAQVFINGVGRVPDQVHAGSTSQLDSIACSLYQLKGGEIIELHAFGNSILNSGSEDTNFLSVFRL
jgi:hypothetical protein